MAVDSKSDASPVTVADREAEAAMRALLARLLPDHGIFGEEAGYEAGTSEDYVWILDPIDGTKSFITGANWVCTFLHVPVFCFYVPVVVVL